MQGAGTGKAIQFCRVQRRAIPYVTACHGQKISSSTQFNIRSWRPTATISLCHKKGGGEIESMASFLSLFSYQLTLGNGSQDGKLNTSLPYWPTGEFLLTSNVRIFLNVSARARHIMWGHLWPMRCDCCATCFLTLVMVPSRVLETDKRITLGKLWNCRE